MIKIIHVAIYFLKRNLLLIFLLLFSAFLRFWNLAELLHWTFDEDVYAFHLKQIVVNHHIPLIGVSAAPLGMELGPLFYWVMSIPFWVGSLNPLSLGIIASSLGVITTALVYKLTKTAFGLRVGIISTLLYTSSFLIVMFDRHFWSVTPQLFISFFVLFGLLQIINKNSQWLIILATVLGFAIQSDLLSLVYFPLVIISLWYFKIPLRNKFGIFSLLIFVLLQLPLVIFELRHNFYNIRALLKFLNSFDSNSFSFNFIPSVLMDLPRFWSRLLYVNGSHDLAYESTYCYSEIVARNNRISQLLLFAVSGLFIFFIYIVKKTWSKNSNPLLKIITWQFVIIVLALFLYGIVFKKNIFEFYFISLVPALIFIFALFLDFLWKHKMSHLALAILSVIVILNTWAIIHSSHSFGYKYKIEMLNWAVSQIGDQPFSIHSLGYCHKYEGHRYLLYYLGKEPVKSYVDPQLTWLFDRQPVAKHPKMGIVFVSLAPIDKEEVEKEYDIFKNSTLNRKVFGATEVLVVENKFSD